MIYYDKLATIIYRCRSRVGAGIEIAGFAQSCAQVLVAPVWGRGLKNASNFDTFEQADVAPVWGRGLK